MAGLQGSTHQPQRPTQLPHAIKAVVLVLVATSFITGFMTSELLEKQEANGTAQSQLQNKIKQIDPELFGITENKTASDPGGNTPKTIAGTSSFQLARAAWLAEPISIRALRVAAFPTRP